MNYPRNTSITILGAKLRQNRNYNFNIMLRDDNFQIIKGTIYNQNQQPSIGAVIGVTQIRDKDSKRHILGYSYTDENGEYVFAIEARPHMQYEIAVYSPLT